MADTLKSHLVGHDFSDRPPIGVHIVHQHYPGFIDVLPNALYLVDGGGLRGGVQVLRHVRPLIVTDFDNSFSRTDGSVGQVFTRLERPIGEILADANVVDAIGLEGRSAPTLAIEKGPRGRIFYQDVFTELQTLTEFFEPSQSDGLVAHGLLLRRFIATYRFLHPDPRLEMPSEAPIESTPLRVGRYVYASEERSWPFEQRIEQAYPSDLQLSIMALGRGVRSLRDHYVSPAELEKRSRNLNAWLCNGFDLPENLVELERLADLAFIGKRLRAAVIEAISILEISLLQARDRVPMARRRASSMTKTADDLTLKFLVNAVLPQLLRAYDGDPGPVIKKANEARVIRNNVVHSRSEPTLEQTNLVLSSVRTVLSIFELPDSFKGNFKLRSPPP
ncbi:hypothetical protein [Emcibacter sp. SYSU 3D8]|uniref:hypothetical protein n=1 Tax=Emcibacter sp. SYSU 3D8 TaxID=3133969 RepID=UPI0031FE9C51